MSDRTIKNKNTQFVSSLLTTKGDLLTRDSSAVKRLPVGTDGHVLTADSTDPNGVKWAPSAGGGGGTWQPPEIFSVNAGIVSSNQVTISSVPIANSELVYLNGQYCTPGVSEDYTIAGTVVTFNPGISLVVGDKIVVKFQL